MVRPGILRGIIHPGTATPTIIRTMDIPLTGEDTVMDFMMDIMAGITVDIILLRRIIMAMILTVQM